MTEIAPSTLRILNAKGQTIGAGFLVSKTLAATCAHAALVASPDGEALIHAQFTGQKQPLSLPERARLRAELDGMIAHLYSLTESEFAHILAAFPLACAIGMAARGNQVAKRFTALEWRLERGV